MNGYMYISDKPVCLPEIYSPMVDMEMITKNEVLSVLYKYPSFHPHITRPPIGVKIPRKSVSQQDILPPPVLWHEKSANIGCFLPERRNLGKRKWGKSWDGPDNTMKQQKSRIGGKRRIKRRKKNGGQNKKA
ncbi:unnamed protein product [Ilex paraguariensis]|uniref:Xrn1 helical domain-containing protein n=1 Tax=Ilex paraguariensis TaxID=185542 RepID=A0ABC8RGV0_9AQUA